MTKAYSQRRGGERSCHEMKPVSRTSVAWLAGLMDGEAWFGLAFGDQSTLRALIRVTMRDERAVRRVARIAGCGRLLRRKPTPNGSPLLEWTAACGDAERVCRMVYRHLIVKREQAALILRSRKMQAKTKGRRLSEADHASRVALRAEMWRLNRPWLGRGVTKFSAT